MRLRGLILAMLVATLGCATKTGDVGSGIDRVVLERVLDEWTTAWSSGNVARLLPLFRDDVYYEDVALGAVFRDKAQLRGFATTIFGSFADLKFEPRSRFVSADGRSGAIEWVFRGRQIKDFPNMPATNRPFAVRGSTVVEFIDGKIKRNADYWDLTTYMKQVGLAR